MFYTNESISHCIIKTHCDIYEKQHISECSNLFKVIESPEQQEHRHYRRIYQDIAPLWGAVKAWDLDCVANYTPNDPEVPWQVNE